MIINSFENTISFLGAIFSRPQIRRFTFTSLGLGDDGDGGGKIADLGLGRGGKIADLGLGHRGKIADLGLHGGGGKIADLGLGRSWKIADLGLGRGGKIADLGLHGGGGGKSDESHDDARNGGKTFGGRIGAQSGVCIDAN